MNNEPIIKTIIGPFSKATIHIGKAGGTQLEWNPKTNPVSELNHNDVHFEFKNNASSRLQKGLLENDLSDNDKFFVLPEHNPGQEIFIWIDSNETSEQVAIFPVLKV